MKGHPSYIFVTSTRLLFFVINLFAVYLMLRGHNLPGGGFIGGLVSAISLILLRLAVGLAETRRILRVDPVYVAAVGLLIAAGTSSAPMVFGRPFLEQFNVHLHDVPLLGDLHVGTPLAFDFGVFLVVVGVTVKILFALGLSAQGLPAFDEDETLRYSSPVETPVEDSTPDAAEPAERGRERRETDAT